MEFLNRIFVLARSLLDVSDTFFDFMLRDWLIGSGVYTTYDLLFGAGLLVVLFYICAAWIKSILSIGPM